MSVREFLRRALGRTATRRQEAAVEECMQAVLDGSRSADECLRAYPELASRLRPLLELAQELRQLLQVSPRDAFVREARERFLFASGALLREALSVEPRPTFVGEARARFLAAAQRLLAPPATPSPAVAGASTAWVRRRLVLAPLAVLFLSFVGFAGYSLATSGDALPGDYRYPVKRVTERVRLALAFDEDSRRGLEIDFTEERISELEALGDKGRSIDQPLLEELAERTTSLVEKIEAPSWPAEDVQKVSELTERQQEVLAKVEPLVVEEAEDELERAKATSVEGREKAVRVLVFKLGDESGPGEGSPAVAAQPATAEAEPTVTGEAEDEEEGSGEGMAPVGPEGEPPTASEPAGEEPYTGALTPEEPPPAPTATPSPFLGPTLTDLPEDTTAGLTWARLSVGSFSAVVPADSTRWLLVDPLVLAGQPVPFDGLVRLDSVDGDLILVVNARTGGHYLFARIGGSFEAVSVDLVAAVRPIDGAVIRHVIESAQLPPGTISDNN